MADDPSPASPAQVAVFAAMGAHRSHADLQRLSCELATLACARGGRRSVVDADGVREIVTSLAVHTGSDLPTASERRVHSEALRALAAVGVDDGGGGGPTAEALLRRHALPAHTAAHLPHTPCHSIRNAHGAPTMNAFEAAALAMRRHPALAAVQRLGLTILCQGATRLGLRGLEAVRAAGGMELAAAAVMRHPSDGEIASHASAALHAVAIAPGVLQVATAARTPSHAMSSLTMSPSTSLLFV